MSELVDQLPRVLAEDDFLSRFTRIFEDISATVDDRVAGIEHLPDVTVTTQPMVDFLAAWLGVDHLVGGLPLEHRRRVVSGAGALLRWRGTPGAIRGLLRLLTDGPVSLRESGGIFPAGDGPGPGTRPWVVVDLAGTGPFTPSQIAAVAMAHVPIDVGFGMTVGGVAVSWDPPPGRCRPPEAPREVLGPFGP